MAQYQNVVGWAQSRSGHYTSAAITEFLSTTEADAFLVAYAMKYREVKIVTKESSNPNMKNRIKLPEPCDAFGIQYCNLITMFREINERF
ncbi:MAG: DUF4411 family protein [Neisseriales bacterium]|nr:MAG: DUF4411 family protein [Neisseriales bacterium]